MKPSTLEWIAKAEGDFTTSQMSYRARKQPNYDAACFHAQQCAEKYLKARLEEAGQPIPKTHNLYGLLTLILPFEPTWNAMTTDLNILNAFAVAYRYPGIDATKLDAKTLCNDVKECGAQFAFPLDFLFDFPSFLHHLFCRVHSCCARCRINS